MTTGWVWDERYMWHDTGRRGRSLPGGEWVEPEPHAESPATKRRLRNLVEVSGLLDRLVPIAATPADRKALLRVHTAEYVDRIDALSAADGGDAGENTPFAAGGGEIAKLAAGGCMAAADAVIDGRVDNCYALVRPPGHHAEPDRGRGYCIFANVAIAVRHVQALRGTDRVAVIDWDVHHGNGTQAIFWRDPTVLAVSVHQDGYYPAASGASDEIGEGPGAGATVNVPLPAGSGVGAYEESFRRVVVPAVRRHRPELIFVSCGFDPSMLEPQAQMMVHSDGFRELTRIVLDLAAEVCGGKLVVCHEGGYSTTYVPFCGLAVVEALAGIRTEVRDPYLEVFRAVRGQELQPHQAAAIELAAARVLG
jgi:acetoin utilization deacetylase AcuC-like enzyme